MLTALLSPRVLLALAAVVALGVAYVKGRSDGKAPAMALLERERAAWANERTKAAQRASEAMRLEIEAHNETLKRLESIHADAEAERAAAADAAARAAAALDRAHAGAGRLRDAIETHRLGTAAALDAAGAAGQCAPATQAADMLRGVLERVDAVAGRLADHARDSSADADRQHAAASECARWADAVRR